jgi:cytochrome c-type biogenesis protein CcmF
MTAYRGEQALGRMQPRLNFYNGRQEPITTPAVRSRPRNDLYVNLLAFEPNGANATFSVIIEPMVFWIWVGGFMIAMGGFFSAWPVRRRTPRRVVRTQSVEVA